MAGIADHPFETTRTLTPSKRTFKTKDGEKREELYYLLAVPKMWADRIGIKEGSPPEERRVKLLYNGIIKILPLRKLEGGAESQP